MSLKKELEAALDGLTGLQVEATSRGNMKVAWVAGKHRRMATIQEASGALVVVSAVCPEEQAPARRVLIEAGRLGGGTAALLGGAYVLRHVVPAARRDAATLREVIVGLAEAARVMARLVTDGDEKAGEDFVNDHYLT